MKATKETLESLQKEVFNLFVYEYDNRNYGIEEHWTSHADAVVKGEKFVDDCDGFAFTVCELLLRMGVDSSDVKFIVCETETGEGHAVSGCTVGDKTYILENRSREIYDWQKRRGYKWHYFMDMKTKQWHEVTNG